MRLSLAFSLFAAFLGTAAFAQESPDRGTNNPHRHADGSWIGITGRVASTSPGAFQLDYGKGTIKVELEPTSTRKHDFIKDEQVRVFGLVDAGFFKGKTIKAHAVYVESLQSYACTMEGADVVCAAFAPAIFSGVMVHGRVTNVGNNTVQVDEGDRIITIDTSALQIDGAEPVANVGDLVTVSGHMDDGLFSRKLKATALDVVQ